MIMKLRGALAMGVAGVSLVGALLVAPLAAEAASGTLWVKPGAGPRDAQAAFEGCSKDAQDIRGSDSVVIAPRGPVVYTVPANATPRVRAQTAAAAGAGGLIGDLLVYAIEENAAVSALRAKALPHCMHAKGYHTLVLNPQEIGEQSRVDSPQKEATWLDALYARPDFAQRVQIASRPHSRLPAQDIASAPPTVFGSLQFDPSKLVAGSGVVMQDGAVLSGSVGHWRTAKLKTSAYLRGAKGGMLPAGAAFQLSALNQTPYWCSTEDSENHVCLRMEGDYYVSIPAKGRSWLVNGVPPNASESGDIDETDIDLVESADDAVGPVDFGLQIRNLTNKSVSLVAVGKRGTETFEFWRNDLDFNDKGEANMRLWTYRMVLTRSGRGVTVRYAPQVIAGAAPMGARREVGPAPAAR